MCPAITVMRPVISYLQKKDQADIFAEPVSAEDVSDCVCVCVSVFLPEFKIGGCRGWSPKH